MADSGYKSISRIDQPKKRTYGWYVRVHYKGTTKSKFLSDIRYGGQGAALAEAVTYRNSLEQAVGKPRSEHSVVGLSPRNRSGMIGVQRRMKSSSKKGREEGYAVYEVTWSPAPGKMDGLQCQLKNMAKKKPFDGLARLGGKRNKRYICSRD